MVQPLRRAKVGDIAITALLLVFFNAVSFGLLLGGRSNVRIEPLRTGYTICLGLAWPIALLSALPLLYFWLKDRRVDKFFLSTATERDSGVMMIAIGGLVLTCLITIVAVIFRLVSELRFTFVFITVFTVVVAVLLVWILVLVVQQLLVVRYTRRQMANERSERPVAQQNDKPGVAATLPVSV